MCVCVRERRRKREGGREEREIALGKFLTKKISSDGLFEMFKYCSILQELKEHNNTECLSEVDEVVSKQT